MTPKLSDVSCRCGRSAMEWVSFTHKNPGRRFVRCAIPVRNCGFWEWIDDPISPLVRSAMDANVKKAEKKVKILVVLRKIAPELCNIFLRFKWYLNFVIVSFSF